MIRTILLLSLIVISVSLFAQARYTENKTTEILNEVSARLNSIKTIHYRYIRELLYQGDNYHSIDSSDVYVDFTVAHNQAGFRFQADDKNFFSCYNGLQYFGLDKIKKTIQIQQNPGQNAFESFSPLYYSIPSLRIILPALVSDHSIKKRMSDTLIGKANCYRLQFELHDQYFSSLGKRLAFTADYTGDKTKPYELIINKNSLLPCQFISKFNDRPADIISLIFKTINIQPLPPAEASWFYSSYTKEYKSPLPVKPLIDTGTILQNWTLRDYNPTNDDSISLYACHGKIVMLDFWMKSCGYCIASFPHLNELQMKFGGEKFQLLSINSGDDVSDVAFFYKKYLPRYKMLSGGEKLVEMYGVSAFPTIILLDQQSKVIYTSEGFDKAAIEKIIREHI